VKAVCFNDTTVRIAPVFAPFSFWICVAFLYTPSVAESGSWKPDTFAFGFQKKRVKEAKPGKNHYPTMGHFQK